MRLIVLEREGWFFGDAKLEFTPVNAVCAYNRFAKIKGNMEFGFTKEIFKEYYSFFSQSLEEKKKNNKTFTYAVSSKCFKFMHALKEYNPYD